MKKVDKLALVLSIVTAFSAVILIIFLPEVDKEIMPLYAVALSILVTASFYLFLSFSQRKFREEGG